MFFGLVGSAAQQLQAGCRYGDHVSGMIGANANHADPFGFLGQWIYEGGMIKHVPWRGMPPCHGANCQADDRMPATTAPASVSVRHTPVPLVFSPTGLAPFPSNVEWVAIANLKPNSGYPHEHEYPP
jgi:hypothetical protein